MNSLISTLDLYFGKKAPQLPHGLKAFLVKVAPYLTLLGVLFSIPAVLLLFGLSIGFGGYGSMMGGAGATLGGVLTVIVIVLQIIALPGLFKPSPKGWTMIFYASLIGLLQNLLMMNWIGFVLGAIISFYFLFQLKPFYFGGVHVATETPASTTPL
jgi:hypothetical protein